MGKNELRLLRFAIRFRGSWHTYGRDRATRDALRSLEADGLIELNRDYGQFRLALSDAEKAREIEVSGAKARLASARRYMRANEEGQAMADLIRLQVPSDEWPQGS